MYKITALLALICLPYIMYAQTKRALIIAIGDYPLESKIPPIASVTDVKYIKAALTKNGFQEQNVDTLINSAATKSGILAGLDRLIATSMVNDVVVVSFSCHGQQIRDQKTAALGKDEDDGYDESFVAYDAKARYSPTGYKGENHLRDDDLNIKLTALRKKIGSAGSILVLLDACHSGTGTRDEGFAATRGEPIPFPDPENPAEDITTIGADINNGFLESNTGSMANMVVFSASSPNQVNKQILNGTEEVGSLSYSFYKAMTELPGNSTYRLLFQKIKSAIQGYIPVQIPLMEGNGNQMIFSGAFSGPDANIYARVGTTGTTAAKDNIFTISHGRMDNITEGTTVRILDAGTKKYITTGTIKKVENFRSTGLADMDLDVKTLYIIDIAESNFGNLHTSITTSSNKADDAAGKTIELVKKHLEPTGLVSFSDKADFQLSVLTNGQSQSAVLTDRNNKKVWESTYSVSAGIGTAEKDELLKTLKNEIKVRYLRTLPDGGLLAPDFKVFVKGSTDTLYESGLKVKGGDRYSLHLQNDSDDNLYYTVLDIYPDNTIEVIYPYNGKEPADYLVTKKSTVIRKLAVSQNSPLGVETLKIIVSKEPMDLRGVFDHKVTRAAKGSFEKMMEDVLSTDNPGMNTRGEVSGVNPEEIGILSTNIVVL